MSSQFVYDHYPLPTADVSHGWATVSIGQVARVIASGFPTGEHNQDRRGVPHIRPMNIDREGRLDLGTLKYVEGDVPRVLSYGDVLFNNTNSPDLIGKTTVILTDSRLAYSNHMTRIRLEDGLNPEFVARQLHFLWMTGYFRHRCVNHVNQASISTQPLSETVPLLVAPTGEQIRIVDELDELLSDLDSGVAALERVQTKLARYRASVLKAAVEGTLTAQWRLRHPRTEPAAELLKCIVVERRRLWEEAQVGKFKEKGQDPPKNWKARYKEPHAPHTANLPTLPEGWCWASWAQVGFSQNGRPFPSGDYQDSGTKLIRPGNLYAGGTVGWTARNTRYLPNRYADRACDLIVAGGELIINLTAQSLKDDFLGRVCITSEDECCLLNQRLARLTPVLIPPKFMLWVFKSAHFRQFVAGLNTGSLIQHMFTSQLEEFVFPLPPQAEQEAIVEVVEDQLSVIDHIQADLETKLKSVPGLRQAVLRQAFTGELVPQDRSDEPAPKLLRRIAVEREERFREAAAAKRTGEQLTKQRTGRKPRAAKHTRNREH